MLFYKIYLNIQKYCVKANSLVDDLDKNRYDYLQINQILFKRKEAVY